MLRDSILSSQCRRVCRQRTWRSLVSFGTAAAESWARCFFVNKK